MSIRWDEFEPQGYEGMVSVLLSRLHPDAQRIDGKGGDGGRDVQIVHGQDGLITDAFELKSFTRPHGFRSPKTGGTLVESGGGSWAGAVDTRCAHRSHSCPS